MMSCPVALVWSAIDEVCSCLARTLKGAFFLYFCDFKPNMYTY